MPRHLQKCYLESCPNSVWVGIGGQGVDPPVRENLRLAPIIGGI